MYFYGSNSTKIDGVRVGDWKYVINGYRKTSWRKLTKEDTKIKLFNLKENKSEAENVIDSNAKKAKQLLKQMTRYDANLEKNISKK